MDKYQAAYAKRLEKLKCNRSPKAIARISAWDAFFNKEYEMQDLESQMADSARHHYEQSDVKNEISFGICMKHNQLYFNSFFFFTVHL